MTGTATPAVAEATDAATAPPASAPAPAHLPMRAALLMAISAVLFGLMAVSIRLASKQLHAFEIAFFRNLFGALFALPLLWRHGYGLLRTDKLRFYFMSAC